MRQFIYSTVHILKVSLSVLKMVGYSIFSLLALENQFSASTQKHSTNIPVPIFISFFIFISRILIFVTVCKFQQAFDLLSIHKCSVQLICLNLRTISFNISGNGNLPRVTRVQSSQLAFKIPNCKTDPNDRLPIQKVLKNEAEKMTFIPFEKYKQISCISFQTIYKGDAP